MTEEKNSLKNVVKPPHIFTKPLNIQEMVSEEELKRKIEIMKKPIRKDALYNQETLKRLMRNMDMAHALYIEADKYPEEERFKKLYEKYSELFITSYALFDYAIKRKLYDGQMGEVIRAFQQAHGDPDKIYQNLQKFQDNLAAQAIQNIEKYKQSDSIAQSEQERIQKILKMHAERK